MRGEIDKDKDEEDMIGLIEKQGEQNKSKRSDSE